jgi:hypothetical protein
MNTNSFIVDHPRYSAETKASTPFPTIVLYSLSSPATSISPHGCLFPRSETARVPVKSARFVLEFIPLRIVEEQDLPRPRPHPQLVPSKQSSTSIHIRRQSILQMALFYPCSFPRLHFPIGFQAAPGQQRSRQQVI